MMHWKPVVSPDHSLYIPLSKKIHDIYKSLITTLQENQSFSSESGLMNGRIGVVVFLYYYSQFSNNKEIQKKANSIIESILFGSNAIVNNYFFSSGITGILWALNHLSKNKFLLMGKLEGIEEIEDYLAKILLNTSESDYDLLYGSIGIGLFFLMSKNPIRLKSLQQLLDGLTKSAVRIGDGIAWESVLVHQTGERGYNLGLAHGMASIIAFLNKLYKLKIYQPTIIPLIKEAISFLMSNCALYSQNRTYFPSWISNISSNVDSRLAWCYGDLGIAFSLFNLSENITDNTVKSKAIEILKSTTFRKNLNREHIVDAGLCHGTSGIAHIYSRMFNYTDDELYKQTAIFWLEETLKMAVFSDGLAGYKSWHSENDWRSKIGLLEGISGIGLTLLSSISHLEPRWDECLLLS